MRYIVICLLLLVALPVFAQDDMMGETVNATASDELVLIGDIHLPEEMTADTPLILTMHMLGGNRGAYDAIIPDLLSAGYAVLNVDLRGHGDTRGSRDWDLALEDVTTWVTFLQDNNYLADNDLYIMGGSIGSNLALMGCAEIVECNGAIALSPGLDYFGTEPQSAVVDGLAERAVLLVASHNDGYSAETVSELFMTATGDVSARLYRGASHGTNLFRTDYDSVSNMVLAWLAEQGTPEDT